MKRIIVCDSGLGGLNIAAHFFRDPHAAPCELIYFNAFPAKEIGFNSLPDERAKEDLFREVLKGMEKFSPDICLVACNTLSVVYESLRKYYTPPFPVEIITQDATDSMYEALQQNPASPVLILGTRTTVESGLHQKRLLQKGVSPKRIYGLACTGIASLMEKDPGSPEIEIEMRQYAEKVTDQFKTRPEKLLLGLCCTHFEFASASWIRIFSDVFGCPVEPVNPNERMGGGFHAQTIRYCSRIGFAPGAKENAVRYFENRVPEIASALASAQPDPSLFAFQENKKD